MKTPEQYIPDSMPCAEVWRKVIKEVQDDALRTALLSDGHEETCECLLCHTYKTIITKRDAAMLNADPRS